MIMMLFRGGKHLLRHYYRDADKSLDRPGRKQANISVRMAWISLGALLCRGKKNLMTARVSMLLKSRASLTCIRACFLPGRAKDLSAPRYFISKYILIFTFKTKIFYCTYVGSRMCTETSSPLFKKMNNYIHGTNLKARVFSGWDCNKKKRLQLSWRYSGL